MWETGAARPGHNRVSGLMTKCARMVGGQAGEKQLEGGLRKW